MITALLAATSAYQPQVLHLRHGAQVVRPRHGTLRLVEGIDEGIDEAGARARSALDAALTDLQDEASSAAGQPYLTQEEREEVLEALAAKRREGDPPPPPPPPPEQPMRALTLNQEALEERLSAPVAPAPPPPPPGVAPPRKSPAAPRSYDSTLP